MMFLQCNALLAKDMISYKLTTNVMTDDDANGGLKIGYMNVLFHNKRIETLILHTRSVVDATSSFHLLFLLPLSVINVQTPLIISKMLSVMGRA